MIKYLFNNTDIFTNNGIKVIKVTGLFDGAALRVTKREWPDKSGTDVDEATIRYKERDITLECLCTAPYKQNLLTQMEAFNAALKGVGVFSIRGDYRAAYLVLSEKELTGKYYRTVNGVAYLFTLKLTDVNPNAIKIITGSVSNYALEFDRGLGMTYWGDGQKQLLEHSGEYTHNYALQADYDIIIDLDTDAPVVEPPAPLPDIDADFGAGTGLSAYISLPCTLKIWGADLSFTWAYAHIIRVYLNEVLIGQTSIPAGSQSNSLNYELNINPQDSAYLRVTDHSVVDGMEVPEKIRATGGISLAGAGITRLCANINYAGTLDFSNNSIPSSDIDYLILNHSYYTAGISDVKRLDISGGTNGVPTSQAAISDLNQMIADGFIYSSNE